MKGYWLMRLGRYLTSLTKPELEILKDNLNMTDDQNKIFELLLKGSSRELVADRLLMSPATVGKKIGEIVKKIERLTEMGLI
jgi:DNA-binding NarL/FixJ family response regulator